MWENDRLCTLLIRIERTKMGHSYYFGKFLLHYLHLFFIMKHMMCEARTQENCDTAGLNYKIIFKIAILMNKRNACLPCNIDFASVVKASVPPLMKIHKTNDNLVDNVVNVFIHKSERQLPVFIFITLHTFFSTYIL